MIELRPLTDKAERNSVQVDVNDRVRDLAIISNAKELILYSTGISYTVYRKLCIPYGPYTRSISMTDM